MSDNKCYYKMTEARLFAYNDLKAKMENDLLDLQDMLKEGPASKSRDILYRSVNGGVRLSPDEIQQIKIDNIKRQIEDCRREISRIDDSVSAFDGDYYALIIKMRYFERKSDEVIAEILNCDVSTVRRNRKRLITRMAVRLYGIKALAI
ncbi:MAG: hypothetical protein BWY15_00841 [Firmicutes bacterium ADurb.Bin193]|nr:MAG: hypothetical protein BWY15_00841 [Firmicutes bacterium ADurb.Bin193]